MTKKNILPDGQRNRIRAVLQLMRTYQLGSGFWGLLLIMMVMSFVVTFEWGKSPRTYVQGEIAEHDIMADHSFSFRDSEATRLRREAVQKAQPVICTLNLEPVDNMLRELKDWFIEAGRTQGNAEAVEKLRAEISEELGEELSPYQLKLMADRDFQGVVNTIMAPWIEERLRDGVIDDTRKLSHYTGGVIVRNLDTGMETVLSDARHLSDIKDLQLDLDNKIRTLPTNVASKKLITAIFSNMSMSTLTINDEATRQSAADAAKAVQPVVQYVSEGEIIVRQGEKISAEQLVKLNALLGRNAERFKTELFIGLLGCSLLMCAGLFFSPSGRKMSFIHQKDMLYVGVMIFFMVILGKVFYIVGGILSASSMSFTGGAAAFAVPVAGAAGVTALTLTTKRHYTTSLLLSVLCTIVSKGGIGLFFYYFMSSMLCAWLVVDSQSRKEVGWAIIPLTIGMLLVWLPSTLLDGGEFNRFTAETISVVLGSFLSIVVIFALSPLVEMIFGFTTRFVLIELMNQEHEALQELMLEAPGTYHHSIIVANMAEQAAKSIGAHSLLCKVGGIYHDIGKVDKADYFIENQFKVANPHDRLTPAMSALVLISHVKRGVELAQQYRLGPEITNIIRQHHGTSLIRYFYHKAQGQNPGVSVEDFSYSGPKPQSREAALIMLADVVEASSRTLAEPTPSRIRAHVEKIVKGVFAEGQLDATELTFKDLDKVTDSFVIILTGIFHKRIEYPDKVPPKPSLSKEDIKALQPVAAASEGRPADVDDANYNAAKWISQDAQRKPGAAPKKARKPLDDAVKKPVRTRRFPGAAPKRGGSITRAGAAVKAGKNKPSQDKTRRRPASGKIRTQTAAGGV